MFYDTHAHLTYPDFASDIEQVIERAQAAGISRIVTIGTDLESSARAIELAQAHPCVYAAIGWHPSDAQRAPADVRPALRELSRQAKVVAIGEVGLDYHRLPSKKDGGTAAQDEAYKEKQKTVFRQQLELAAELGLNCVVHQRDCFEDTIVEVERFAGRVRTVFHCFANPIEDMRRVIAAGSLVSFTGILTFKNAQTVRDTLAATPAGHFMLETDSPFLAPVPYRGKRCEPAYVKEIAAETSKVTGMPAAELSEVTSHAARGFFRGLA